MRSLKAPKASVALWSSSFTATDVGLCMTHFLTMASVQSVYLQDPTRPALEPFFFFFGGGSLRELAEGVNSRF